MAEIQARNREYSEEQSFADAHRVCPHCAGDIKALKKRWYSFRMLTCTSCGREWDIPPVYDCMP